jgi:predicted RNA binding protein YcfA (HicA-like mRNA interferase family)
MKRRDLILHLESHGCRLKREGSNHSIYENPANGQGTAVPRHREINNFTARKICDDLGIPHPPKK